MMRTYSEYARDMAKYGFINSPLDMAQYYTAAGYVAGTPSGNDFMYSLGCDMNAGVEFRNAVVSNLIHFGYSIPRIVASLQDTRALWSRHAADALAYVLTHKTKRGQDYASAKRDVMVYQNRAAEVHRAIDLLDWRR